MTLRRSDGRPPAPSRRTLMEGAAALTLAGAAGHARASDYPVRPVRILLGFQPGAATDTLARSVAQSLGSQLGQQFIVENRPGAATRIAMEAVGKAEPDGYTLGLATAVTTAFPLMFDGAVFDPGATFAPIGMVGRAPTFVAVRASLAARDFKDFAAYAKGRSLTMGHPGNGSNPHVAGLALGRSLGATVVPVPYRGTQPTAIGLAAGEIDYAMLEFAAAQALVESGGIRLLAVTEPRRTELRPEVPTGREVGATAEIEGVAPWFMLIAPPRTPPSITALIGEKLQATFDRPDFKSSLAAVGIEPDRSGPAETTAFFAEQRAKLTRLIGELNINLKS